MTALPDSKFATATARGRPLARRVKARPVALADQTGGPPAWLLRSCRGYGALDCAGALPSVAATELRHSSGGGDWASGHSGAPPGSEGCERTKDWTEQDYLATQQDGVDVERRLLALFNRKAGGDGAQVLAAVDEHYAVCRFWAPDQAAYTALGRLLVEQVDQRARLDGLAPGFAEYCGTRSPPTLWPGCTDRASASPPA